MTARYFTIERGGVSPLAGVEVHVSETDSKGWVLKWIADFTSIHDARLFVRAAGLPSPNADPVLIGNGVTP